MTSSATPLRVVLITVTGDFVPTLEGWLKQKGHRLVGVLSAPGPRSRRTDGYLDVARHARPGLDIIISNYRNRWADMIRPLRPDLLVCASFNWKIPPEVFAVSRLGAINGHDALLPKYRGRNATGWALRNDEPAYGVTIHYMTSEFDDGPILSQRKVPITDEDIDVESIRARFFAAAKEATFDALDKVVAGDPGVPQDESQATFSPGAFEPEWREIDWSKPARHTFIQVRSWYGARDVPLGAFGPIDGVRMLITKTKLVDIPPSGRAPGTVLERNDNGVLIQCGDKPLLLLDPTPVETESMPRLQVAAG